MSVQYGVWNFDGQALDPHYLENVNTLLAPYGPDSAKTYSTGEVNILFRAFHTTKESHREIQPYVSSMGAVMTWDGRLDNREELLRELKQTFERPTDLEIVSAAYDKWGTDCFAKFIGDWALSIWSPIERSLFLATDPIGARHLYYSLEAHKVTWSTILEPIVQFAGKTFQMCEEYIAGFFAYFTATNLTPFVGIHAVPPASCVLIRPGQQTVHKYWSFNPAKRIRYRSDAEYEEHFRTLLATAVRRRLRCDRPVLAELSGGMDSSSIVCMADIVMARGEVEAPRLDTISYYNDADTRLDERPYFTKVEEKRGRAGYHIDLGAKAHVELGEVELKDFFLDGFEINRLAATPNFGRILSKKVFDSYKPYIEVHGYRVVLSGGSGEDVTGGYVPTPICELQDLLVRARLFRLARQLNAWARRMRKSPLALLWETLRGFWGTSLMAPWAPKELNPPSWLKPSFVQRNKAALSWYPSRLTLFGGLPSFQYQLQLFSHKQRVLAYRSLWPELLYEIRYPYLDRDLLEFACAIPRDQMVGVGKRRFLMKRALAGIVPDDLLNRKPRAPTMNPSRSVSPTWLTLADENKSPISDSLGVVDAIQLLEAIGRARAGNEVRVDSLKRALCLESWLGHLATHGVLATPLSSQETGRSPYEQRASTTVQPESSAS